MDYDPLRIIHTIYLSRRQRMARKRGDDEPARQMDEVAAWEERQMEPEDTGVEINTPWIKLKGSGVYGVVMLLAGLVIGAVMYVGWQQQEEHRAIVNSQAAIVNELKDVFLAVMLPPEAKETLPAALKEKIKSKAEDKAKRKIERLEAGE